MTLTSTPGRTDAAEVVALRAEVRAFLADASASGVFVPRCDSWITGHSPSFSRTLGERGWIGLNWPSRYGGRDRPEMERYAITEELLAAGAPVAAHWFAQRQTGPLLIRHGTEEQRVRFLPAIARGECYFAICMSEPNAGSDLAAVRTSAEKVDGGWRVNGRKVWTSHAHVSHFGIVLCRTSPLGERRHEGLSQLIVDLHAAGVSIRPIRLLNGEGHFSEVVLDDVFVPDDMVVGSVGNGWSQVLSELAFERSGPERFLSTMPLILAFIDAAGADPDAETAETIGRIGAELWTLRRMSIDISRALGRGEAPNTRAALVKELGTRFEQWSIDAIRRLSGDEPDPESTDRVALLLAQAIAAAPTFTLRGGTSEILRGIVARDLVSS
ncbi:MAG TPA: acyl-CoA dehydrogenase family protein [Candidatus Limnocylindria bacterium]